MSEFRIEKDTMGEVRIPRKAYYGPQTQRAVENFPISGRTLPVEMIHALGWVKWAAAKTNEELGLFSSSSKGSLADARVQALLTACVEVAEGKWDREFPIDVFQTGSGTSSNMNVNEVVAQRAQELAGEDRRGKKWTIHPNDHVNFGQSTNDTFPTAIHVATADQLRRRLLPALKSCEERLLEKSRPWESILKIGRTHLADATPMTLGQEIGGLARQFALAGERARQAIESILELPVGGTAVGTGINTHPEFGHRVAEHLAERLGIPFREAENHFEANSQREGLVVCHGLLRSVAVTLMNVSNHLRWLASGPRCGFAEIVLPDLQPGSSIMPGKVNPVICESAMQVAARVMGNDQAIAAAGATGGPFQLNIMMPMMADTVLESVRLLANASSNFEERCLRDMEPHPENCRDAVEKSLSMATGLNLYLGYEKAAALAKEALETGKTIRRLCEEKKVLPAEQLEEALDPWKMTRPRGGPIQE